MHPVIAKTFGGLSSQYYFRQFLFGLAFPALIYVMSGVTMLLCWAFAIFIAPIGLAYLYYHHSKAERET